MVQARKITIMFTSAKAAPGNEFSVTAVVKDSAEESLFVDGKKVMTQTGKNAVLANNVAEGRCVPIILAMRIISPSTTWRS